MTTTRLLAIAGGLFAAFVLGSSFDSSSPSKAPLHPTPAADVVTLDGSIKIVRQKSKVPIYKVPKDRRLVITDCILTSECNLLQRKNGKETVLCSGIFVNTTTRTRNYRTDLAFEPGSIVLLERKGAHNVWIRHHIRGYLTDK